MVTGYRTDLQGEIEISAWEVRSGCGPFWFAWVIDLGGLFTFLRWPGATVRAFARGRSSRNLYGADYDAVLQRPVDEVRSELGLDGPVRVRPTDALALIALLPVAAVCAAFVAGAALVTAPWWLRAGVHRHHRTPASD